MVIDFRTNKNLFNIMYYFLVVNVQKFQLIFEFTSLSILNL